MGHGAIGMTKVYEESKDAIMQLLSPLDFPLLSEHFSAEQTNYDVTIVHELLHLHFAPFQEDDETPKGIAQEQAINCISATIVAAYGKNVCPPVTTTTEAHTGHYL